MIERTDGGVHGSVRASVQFPNTLGDSVYTTRYLNTQRDKGFKNTCNRKSN